MLASSNLWASATIVILPISSSEDDYPISEPVGNPGYVQSLNEIRDLEAILSSIILQEPLGVNIIEQYYGDRYPEHNPPISAVIHDINIRTAIVLGTCSNIRDFNNQQNKEFLAGIKYRSHIIQALINNTLRREKDLYALLHSIQKNYPLSVIISTVDNTNETAVVNEIQMTTLYRDELIKLKKTWDTLLQCFLTGEPKPIVESVSPKVASDGDRVTVTGKGFNSTTMIICKPRGQTSINGDYNEYNLNCSASPINILSDKELQFIAPITNGDVDLIITNGWDFSNDTPKDDFTINSTPRIASLTPNKGKAGDKIKIKTKGFKISGDSISPVLTLQDRITVKFGDKIAEIVPEITTSFETDTFKEIYIEEFEVIVPNNTASKVDVVISLNGTSIQSTNTPNDDFTYENVSCKCPTGQIWRRGTCTTLDLNCPSYVYPYCGCDGVTYQNACWAIKSGVMSGKYGACTH
jgi:hypothetical protein